MNEILFAALSFGFMGSLHCMGMCGALVGALTMGSSKLWRPGLFIYQLGRITTYALLGLSVGFIGAGLEEIGGDLLQRIIAALVGLLMIAFGLHMTGLIQDPLRHLTGSLLKIHFINRHIQTLAQRQTLFSWFTFGLINGLLPCGLVYAALAMALTSKNTGAAVLVMALFGIGTIPAMMFAPVVMRQLTPRLRGNMLRIAGVLMILYGIYTGLRGSKIMPSMDHHSGHDHHHSQKGSSAPLGRVSGFSTRVTLPTAQKYST